MEDGAYERKISHALVVVIPKAALDVLLVPRRALTIPDSPSERHW